MAIATDTHRIAPGRHSTRQGVLLFLGALTAFACYDAFAKQMLLTQAPGLVNLGRYVTIVSMALVLLLHHRRSRPSAPPLWRQPHQGLLLLRSAMLATVATSFMTALVDMPLAEATALYFTAPLFMVLLSPWLLGEHVGRVQWTAVALGFTGMLLVVRPGGDLPLAGTLAMLLAAICYAVFQILTRRLSGLVPAPVQFAHMAVVCLVVTTTPTLLSAHIPLPSWQTALVLLGGGLVSGCAQLMLLGAFARVKAATLAPLNYIQLLLAVLISTLWFQRPPDSLALAGIALIIAAGVYLATASRPAR